MTRDEAIAKLRELLHPGDTVQTILRHVSRSGMSRSISPVIGGEDVSYLVAPAVGHSFDRRHGGVRVSGCGMDMGFHLVYSLSRVLYPDGFPVTETLACKHCLDRPGYDGLGRQCKHCNGKGTITRPVRGRNGDMSGWDKDGGYALRHRWL